MTDLTAADDAQHGKALKKKLIGGGNIREPRGVNVAAAGASEESARCGRRNHSVDGVQHS